MKKLIVSAIAVLSLAAHADFKDGNKLYNQIVASNDIDQMVALGYITGVMDAYQGVLFCIRDNVTAGQANDIVKQYLYNNPSTRHFAASTLIVSALAPIWPCQAKKKGTEL